MGSKDRFLAASAKESTDERYKFLAHGGPKKAGPSSEELKVLLEVFEKDGGRIQKVPTGASNCVAFWNQRPASKYERKRRREALDAAEDIPEIEPDALIEIA